MRNHTSCSELRKSQFELEKTLTKANIKMNQMSSVSDKNYKAAFIKMLNQIHIILKQRKKQNISAKKQKP